MPDARDIPIAVFFGDEDYQKRAGLKSLLDRLLPPDVDRGMALVEYDGSRSEEQGGPALAAVLDDLLTPGFLAPRRVIVITDADRFISAHRDRLENYLQKPSRTGTLVLLCRSFPSTTRLSRAATAAGGELTGCKKLTRSTAPAFAQAQAGAWRKRMSPAAVARLIDLVGFDQGTLAGEVEKLALYSGERAEITEQDLRALVGQSREERIFEVLDSAATGRLPTALQQWRQTLATDPDAIYKATGGVAFVLRRWLAVHEALRQGAPFKTALGIAAMWGRDRELRSLLERLPPKRLRGLLAALAELDAQSKVGARSIETGVERLLVEVAAT